MSTVDAEPERKCQCGGTYSRHRLTCPWAPLYGYDDDGKPFTESQLPKAAMELGRRAAEHVNDVAMKILTGAK